MKKLGKSMMVFVLVLTLGISLAEPGTRISAKTKGVTDAQLEKVMECYKTILQTNPYKDYDGGFTAETFSLKDLDKDGVPELIINGEAPQIFSYDLANEKEMFLFNSWVYNKMYYSSKTKTILYTYEWKGKKEWSFYKVNNTQKTDASTVLEALKQEYSYTNGKYDEYDNCKAKKGYYKGKYFSEDAKYTTKKAVDAAIKKLVPAKVELKTSIKNTKENREKYLGDLKQFKESGV